MSVLVVSPHPDDETLGACGTILKYKKEGKKIYWLNITDIKEEYGYDKSSVEKRTKEISKVKELYNFDGFYNLRLNPTRLDEYGKSYIIGLISDVIKDLKPNTIILPYENDVHSDHRIVYECVFSCTKVFRYPYIKKVMCMEIISESDFASSQNGFIPNYFVDITDFIEDKMEIINIYESELGNHPFPRSLESLKALAILRGISCGVRYAEAFKLIKFIE